MTNIKKSNTKKNVKPKLIKIHASDLPLSCPRQEEAVWNLHPQVYLPIEKTGEEVCPYCSNHYVFVEK
jgi:uncharacterized Zn-finger protein